MPVFVSSGVQVVPHDRTDTPTPPAVDLSMSPSSRHTPSSPEMTNGNYIPSGVSNPGFRHTLTPAQIVTPQKELYLSYTTFYVLLQYLPFFPSHTSSSLQE